MGAYDTLKVYPISPSSGWPLIVQGLVATLISSQQNFQRLSHTCIALSKIRTRTVVGLKMLSKRTTLTF